MPKIELTNMVMIRDELTGKVLVQDRVKSWKGLSFPGGHAEDGESLVDSAVREIKEETGLDIRNMKSRGVIHWVNNRTFDRYLVFLYATSDYSGELLAETDEGKNLWIDPEELKALPSTNGFPEYFPMFFGEGYNEAFGSWNDDLYEVTEYK